MQSEMWVWLLRRVPADQYNQLMLLTRSGMEIAVQTLLRIEAEFVAIKGRLAGSQDAGRVFLIPFTNIDYVGFQKDVKESEFDAIFGTGSLTPVTGAAAPPAPGQPVSTESASGAAPGSSVEVPVTTSISQKTPLPLKSEVLERFRSRIAGASPSLGGVPLRPADG
jgi:hypothetical protein